MSCSVRRKPSISNKSSPLHEATHRACQENNRIRNLIHLAHSPQRCSPNIQRERAITLRVHCLLQERRLDVAGADGVDADGVLAAVGVCVGFCEAHDAVFGGCVGCVMHCAGGGDDAVHARDVDDAAAAYARTKIPVSL